MLPVHVGLVAEESRITPGELSEVAAALQKQVTRDFGPYWGIAADVTAFPSLEHLPLDYWPIVVRDDINQPGAAGYHDDDHGQPFSLVEYSEDWTLTASHEVLEMLGDPFGRRLIAGDSPVAGQGRVQFLVEVCDPSEAATFAYSINGVTVSDFYTPRYFDPVTSPAVRYSFTGALTHPRQVVQGGYLSWYVPSLKQWWQRTWFGAQPVDKGLKGLKIRNGNIRNAIDRINAPERREAMASARSLTAARSAGVAGGSSLGFKNRADDLRAAIGRAMDG